MNPLGFLCYSVRWRASYSEFIYSSPQLATQLSNIALYASPTVRREYRERHDGHSPQVQPNDIAFAVHACAISSLTLVQSFVFKVRCSRSGLSRVLRPSNLTGAFY